MPEAAAFELLDAAWEFGIRCFDTAEAYGVARDRLTDWLDRRGNRASARVITKISVASPVADIAPAAANALGPFQGAAELTLLSHGAAGDERWRRLSDAATAAGARAGQSVYGPEEVAAAWRSAGTSVVQVPGNVFDLRAMTILPPDGGEMHYRSLFLQGILLDIPVVAEARVSGSGRLAAAVQAASEEVGVPAAALLVAAVLRRVGVYDKVVLGMDSAEELQAISCASRAPSEAVDHFMRRVTEQPAPHADVLDPRQWVGKS